MVYRAARTEYKSEKKCFADERSTPYFGIQASFQRENQDAVASHVLVSLLSLFNQDNPLSTNVAEAYPAIDNSAIT
jgi:hypothetical protein